MRFVYQIGFILMSVGLFVSGILFDNVVLLALSLSLGYLVLTLLESRFTETRGKMVNEAVEANGMTMEETALYLPFSSQEGVFVFKKEKESRLVNISGVNYPIHSLKPYEIKGGEVKKGELETKFLDFVFISKWILRTTFLLSLALATFFIYQENQYGYLVVPIGLLLFHVLSYSGIGLVARQMRVAKSVNKDREYLHDLMVFYGEVMLGIENPVPKTDVFPTGDILVRFDNGEETEFYYVPFNERVWLEMTAEGIAVP